MAPFLLVASLGFLCYSLVMGWQIPTLPSLNIGHDPVLRRTTSVPKYVLEYAPLCHLDTSEVYMPSDLMAQLNHTHPEINSTIPVSGAPAPLTLDNLNKLNQLGNASIYLTSDDDYTKLPPWLHGVRPDSRGKTEGAISCAIVVHDHQDPRGTVDAFFFYFYAYNQGNKLFGVDELGDHLGDWEHNMIRFRRGQPKAVWYSQHNNGGAYTYEAVEKSGKRIVNYVGNGTHANWATIGKHDHSIPDLPSSVGPLIDYTDNGTLWDPLLSAYFFTVDFPNNTNGDDEYPTFASLPNPYNSKATTPVNWLYFNGQWGNNQLPSNDSEQKSFFDVAFKYTAGPNGPRFKGLNRVDVCPADGDECIVRRKLLPGS